MFFLNVCPFDNTAFAVSWKDWIPLTGLTTSVVRLLLLQVIVLSRSAIVVLSKFWWCLVLSRCVSDFSLGVGTFVIGLSQISSFFSFLKSERSSLSGIQLRSPVTTWSARGYRNGKSTQEHNEGIVQNVGIRGNFIIDEHDRVLY